MTITDTHVFIDPMIATELTKQVTAIVEDPAFSNVTGQARKTLLDVAENGAQASGHTENFIKGAIDIAQRFMAPADLSQLQARVDSIFRSPVFGVVKGQVAQTLRDAGNGVEKCEHKPAFIEGACNIADTHMQKYQEAYTYLEQRIEKVTTNPFYGFVDPNSPARLMIDKGMPEVHGPGVINLFDAMKRQLDWLEDFMSKTPNHLERVRGDLQWVTEHYRFRHFLQANPNLDIPEMGDNPTPELVQAVRDFHRLFRSWLHDPLQRMGIGISTNDESNNGRHRVRRGGKSSDKREADRQLRASMKGKPGQKPQKGKQN